MDQSGILCDGCSQLTQLLLGEDGRQRLPGMEPLHRPRSDPLLTFQTVNTQEQKGVSHSWLCLLCFEVIAIVKHNCAEGF